MCYPDLCVHFPVCGLHCVCCYHCEKHPIDLTANQNATVAMDIIHPLIEYECGQAICLLISHYSLHPYHGPLLSWTAMGPPHQFFDAV